MSRVLPSFLFALLAAPADARDEELPAGAVRATVVEVIDGDTVAVRPDGDDEIVTVRLIGIDTPETVDPNTPDECYGAEASRRLTVMLPVGRTVWLEQDVSDEDRYDRLRCSVWFKGATDGDAYLANELLVREGYAVVSTYPPDVAHVERLTAAQDLAVAEAAGLWASCGGADTPLDPAGPDAPAGGDADVGGAAAGCDPSYPTLCLPVGSPDLDCPEVGAVNVPIVPPDPHGFDRDRDGVGCER